MRMMRRDEPSPGGGGQPVSERDNNHADDDDNDDDGSSGFRSLRRSRRVARRRLRRRHRHCTLRVPPPRSPLAFPTIYPFALRNELNHRRRGWSARRPTDRPAVNKAADTERDDHLAADARERDARVDWSDWSGSWIGAIGRGAPPLTDGRTDAADGGRVIGVGDGGRRRAGSGRWPSV